MNEEEAIEQVICLKEFLVGEAKQLYEQPIETILNLLKTKQAEIERLRNSNKDLLRKLRNRVKEVKKLTKYSLYKKEFATLNKQLEKKDLEITALKMKHEHDVKMIDEVKGEAVKLYKEIEKKDKIIKSVYREANNVLYFDDNSDYCCALWEILRIINPELEEYPTLNYIDEEDK